MSDSMANMGSLPSFYSRPKLTPAQRQEISYRRGDGASLRQIAAEFSISVSVVHNHPIVERPHG